jgi:hypothetical protein
MGPYWSVCFRGLKLFGVRVSEWLHPNSASAIARNFSCLFLKLETYEYFAPPFSVDMKWNYTPWQAKSKKCGRVSFKDYVNMHNRFMELNILLLLFLRITLLEWIKLEQIGHVIHRITITGRSKISKWHVIGEFAIIYQPSPYVRKFYWNVVWVVNKSC